MTEALRAEADEIEDKIAVLRSRRGRIRRSMHNLFDSAEESRRSAACDALSDEIETLKDRLAEIEDELAFADWREERRDSPIVL